jgi:hypothetical protein
MIEVSLYPIVGSFAENKDLARQLRVETILPALEKGEAVVLDFSGVESVTQSFIHALISDLFRKYGSEVLDQVTFKSCSLTVQKIVTIVSEYMQESQS